MRWLLALLLTACSTPAAPAPVPPVASPPRTRARARARARSRSHSPARAAAATRPQRPRRRARLPLRDRRRQGQLLRQRHRDRRRQGGPREGLRLRRPRGQAREHAETIFRIGSVSKQFAATAVLALVADGKLRITDPLSKFFPDYPKRNLTRDGVEVTLHHLLSHTSGLPDPRATDTFSKLAWRRTIDPYEQMAWVSTVPLVRKPGTAFQYLNYNFLLAALIVEKTTGQRYEDFLKQRFFVPLGMTDTGTILPAASEPRAAAGYEKRDGAFANFAGEPLLQGSRRQLLVRLGADLLDGARSGEMGPRRSMARPCSPRRSASSSSPRTSATTATAGWCRRRAACRSNGTTARSRASGSPRTRSGFRRRIGSSPTSRTSSSPIIEPFEAKVDALVLK